MSLTQQIRDEFHDTCWINLNLPDIDGPRRGEEELKMLADINTFLDSIPLRILTMVEERIPAEEARQGLPDSPEEIRRLARNEMRQEIINIIREMKGEV